MKGVNEMSELQMQIECCISDLSVIPDHDETIADAVAVFGRSIDRIKELERELAEARAANERLGRVK